MQRTVAGVLIAAALAAAVPAQAQRLESTDQPVLLSADQMRYDAERDVVSAAGNVEIHQAGRILLADRLTYDRRADAVTAEGNISILEPSGEVLFADRVELRDDLKEGVVEKIRILFTDDSRLAANGGRRSGGNRTVFAKAVYSPCDLCAEDPERAPLWQVKAAKVVHNQSARRIDYYDAWLEFYGVPVAYTPFFSHPDPTVDRKTGFLVPRYGSSSELGLTLETPFYFNIAPDKDATFSPLFTTEEGVVLAGEYRQRFEQGSLQFSGSITRPDKRDDFGNKVGGTDTRGHIFGTGRFQLDETWRWGFDIARASDDTYLRRYDISSADTLTTTGFIEGFRGRNYAAARTFAFQGLREDDDPGLTPTIWPTIDYSFVGQPGPYGDRYSLDVNLLQLTRSDGTDSRRFSVIGGWRLPYVAPAGDVYSLSLSLRGDLYLVSDAFDPNVTTTRPFSGTTGRFHPQAAFEWRYPFVRESGSVRQIIEPVAQFVVSPYASNDFKIPNEDSVSFEFDDTNLLSENRFPGLDRVEGGPRVNLALKGGVYGASGGSTTFLFGQSYRLKADDSIPELTGLETTRSDYVGRLVIAPSENFEYIHRFRLDRDDFGFRRNEIDLAVALGSLKLDVGFVSLSREESAEEATTRRELRTRGEIQLTDYWRARASWRRDLGDDDGTISAAAGVTYEDECIIFTIDFQRDLTRDRDAEPSTSVNFSLALKNLG